MSTYGHNLGKYFKGVPHVWGKEKVVYFFADRVGFKVSFFEI